VAFRSATFFCARKNAARFSSSGAKKRRLPPNVMQYLCLKFFANLWQETIDKYRII